MEHKIRILKVDLVTHDTSSFIVDKPENYKFEPGQATSVSINKSNLEKQKRPFTFASLNKDLVLEFIIKKYQDGITEKIHELKPGYELIIGDAGGNIEYKGAGVFIAAGTGITPFLAILRQLKEDKKLNGNALFFSNKTSKDLILENELKDMLKDKLFLTLTREKKEGYSHGRINAEFIKRRINDFKQEFYVCGPKEFVSDIKEVLKRLGVKEKLIISEI